MRKKGKVTGKMKKGKKELKKRRRGESVRNKGWERGGERVRRGEKGRKGKKR